MKTLAVQDTYILKEHGLDGVEFITPSGLVMLNVTSVFSICDFSKEMLGSG